MSAYYDAMSGRYTHTGDGRCCGPAEEYDGPRRLECIDCNRDIYEDADDTTTCAVCGEDQCTDCHAKSGGRCGSCEAEAQP